MHFFGGPDAAEGEPVYALSDHETEKARYWLPCIDLPSVRTTAAFHLTTRNGHVAFANGVKTSEAPLPLEQQDDGGIDGGGVEGAWAGKRTLTVWRMDFPCPSYLLCVAVRILYLYGGQLDGWMDRTPPFLVHA
jgi:aminopeptidase N